ncbi:UDP-glycosyltransferase 71K2-like [Humulus lupulus]|uniref:UDP-glycosyltransferase 71K2-like n=1 Tax=Humulus lupulus TaxID=3486 RepID=UPI002B40BDFF|nr:UDP-glycosyltransferase 71K2-like [Humulus lupulus]
MKRAKLAFIPGPRIGHLVSALQFSKRLLHCDDRLFITILRLKFPLFPDNDAYTDSLVGSLSRVKLVHVSPVDPPPKELFKSPEYYVYAHTESLVPLVRNALTDIVSSHSNSETSQGDVVLVLDFFCMPMMDVANELGLPAYMFMTSNLGFLNGGYSAHVKLAQRFRQTKGIIVNSIEELEAHAVSSLNDGETPPIYMVGPVLDYNGQPHPTMDQVQNYRILQWLDEQPQFSVVFLCFGSTESFGASQLREIASGLELSGHRFLWSIRVPQPTTIDEILPEGFLERIGSKGMIFNEWAPQWEGLCLIVAGIPYWRAYGVGFPLQHGLLLQNSI